MVTRIRGEEMRRFIRQIIEQLCESSAERDFRKLTAHRSFLSESHFAQQFSPDLAKQRVATVVARVLNKQLGVSNVRASDNIAAAFPDVGFDEIANDVAEELRVVCPQDTLQSLDGTVGNLVDVLHELLRVQGDVTKKL